jgi:chorismate mutase
MTGRPARQTARRVFETRGSAPGPENAAGTRRLIGAALATLLTVAMPAAADPLAEAMFARIAERLALMKPVAAWKLAHGAAIEDPAREAVVLEEAAAAAAAAGLAAESARPFFAAQIEAAKAIQRCWIARWNEKTPPPRPPPDLGTEIRPRLLVIGAALLADVEAALASGVVFERQHAADFATAVDVDCLPPDARDAIYHALAGVRLAR